MNEETILQRHIMLALSDIGCLVFRNETAAAWVGKVLHKAGNQVTLGNAKQLPFGLCVGSSDIVGIRPDGIFFAIEVKTKTGKPTKDQLNFIRQIKSKNGIAGIARTIEDALRIIYEK